MKSQTAARLAQVMLVAMLASPVIGVFAASELSVIPAQVEGSIRSDFTFTIKPGESAEDVVVIGNNSGREFTLQVTGRDASYASNGSLQISENAGSQGLGSWIAFETPQITVPSGESVEAKFKISIPANATIGEHYAGILAQESSGTGVKASTSVRVTIPGAVQRKVSWGKIDHTFANGKLIFNVEAKNESNINLQPSLDIEYQGLFGKARQATLAPSSTPPGGTIKFEAPWEHLTPILGLYRFKLTLHTLSVIETLPDGKIKTLTDQTITTDYSFTTGGKLLGGVLLGTLILWLLFRYQVFARDKKKFMTRTAHHKVKAGESIMHIAAATGIQPKRLIQFNRLAWPYTVAAGDTILIPGRRLHRTELTEKHPEDRLRGFGSYILSTRPTLYHPRPNIAVKPEAPSRPKTVKKVTPKKPAVAKRKR